MNRCSSLTFAPINLQVGMYVLCYVPNMSEKEAAQNVEWWSRSCENETRTCQNANLPELASINYSGAVSGFREPDP